MKMLTSSQEQERAVHRLFLWFIFFFFLSSGDVGGNENVKAAQIEAARCNDIPPERGMCCCCCLRHRRCSGYMAALLAPAVGLIQHFLKEVAKDRLKLQRMFCLGYRQNTCCQENVILTSHKLLKRAFTPTQFYIMTFLWQNCLNAATTHLRQPFWSEIKTNETLWRIGLMRYDSSSERKSVLVCCFQTNPLKVIWSPAANYRASLAASPDSTFHPIAALAHHRVPSSCLDSPFNIIAPLFQRLRLTAGRCGSVIRLCLAAVTELLLGF